jgi:hypothetical protein
VCSRSRLLAATLAAAVGLGVLASTAGASRNMRIGVYDEGATLFDEPETVFARYRALRVNVLRVNLYWGGRLGVAERRPFDAADPRDAAYDWEVYDRTAHYARANGIELLFTITGTPRWANGGQSANRPPLNYADLRKFAYAAAARYSGNYIGTDGRTLPAVRLWAAWNEPNNPAFLRPQFVRRGGTWVFQGAAVYAKICNAVYSGVHATMFKGEQVACGVTGPRGNNNPTSGRPSTSPIAFLRAAKQAGMKTFDAYAHNPYYGAPSETPTTKPPPTRSGQAPTAITFANVDTLIADVTRLYGRKPLWITEYGYQTKPPDRQFGVSWALQAKYLRQAFAIARKHPRIALMLWFLVRDQPDLSGWQSGLVTVDGKKKPAFDAFRNLPR